MKKIKKYISDVNENIAIKISNGMGTMWCAYTFFIMSIIPWILQGIPTDPVTAIQYLSGAIIQLVSLPIIIVSSKILGKAAELRSQKDHVMIQKSFKELHEIHLDLHNKFDSNIVEQQWIREKLEKIEKMLMERQ